MSRVRSMSQSRNNDKLTFCNASMRSSTRFLAPLYVSNILAPGLAQSPLSVICYTASADSGMPISAQVDRNASRKAVNHSPMAIAKK